QCRLQAAARTALAWRCLRWCGGGHDRCGVVAAWAGHRATSDKITSVSTPPTVSTPEVIDAPTQSALSWVRIHRQARTAVDANHCNGSARVDFVALCVAMAILLRVLRDRGRSVFCRACEAMVTVVTIPASHP